MSRVAVIGGKHVSLAELYSPRSTEAIGRESIMRVLSAAWMGGTRAPLSPLLIGEPGVGKNHVVYAIARQTGKKLYIVQGHEDLTVEDLACTVRFSDDPGRKMDYVASPLVTAMLDGGILFFDEVAKCRPRALAALASVCDERRTIDSTLLGERVSAHPGFRFVAATNSADLDGMAFPEYLRTRMRPIIRVGYPSREQIDAIVRERYTHGFRVRVTDQIDPLLDSFWASWRNYQVGAPPTPRDAIQVFDLAIGLSDDRLDAPDGAFDLDDAEGAPLLAAVHIEDAVAQFFGRSTGGGQ